MLHLSSVVLHHRQVDIVGELRTVAAGVFECQTMELASKVPRYYFAIAAEMLRSSHSTTAPECQRLRQLKDWVPAHLYSLVVVQHVHSAPGWQLEGHAPSGISFRKGSVKGPFLTELMKCMAEKYMLLSFQSETSSFLAAILGEGALGKDPSVGTGALPPQTPWEPAGSRV
ncbi:hypothetical protein KC340_g43 [Hortaea werneckii]|nr:hypothetical protein KC340_g43 [Hortaea werneckii]